MSHCFQKMDLATYKTIQETVHNYHGLSRKCLQLLKSKFPSISHDTLFSILSYEYQKRMKIKHNHVQDSIEVYWTKYNEAVNRGDNPGIILRLSIDKEVCPCLIAKLILQKYFESKDDGVENTQINTYLRDTAAIPDGKLAYEMFLCTIYDNLYSPLADTMRQSLGQQYEIELHNQAAKLGLAFRDEDHLRKYGFDKTPDVKLDVPVAIDGFIINWIESKALFGGDEVHKDYIKNQYVSYWNRFGPGLVIYWFGYPVSILNKSDRRFIIRDHLPTNIQQICLLDEVNK